MSINTLTGSSRSDFADRDSPCQANVEGDYSSRGHSSLAIADSLARVLDEFDIAVVLTDIAARVLYVNKDARDVIESQGGLKLVRGAIKAGSDLETARLKQLIKMAALNADDRAAQTRHFGMTLSARAEAGIQSIVVAGLGTNRPDNGPDLNAPEARAVLFVSHGKHRNGIPNDILRVMFGLTSSEATIASRLIEGRGLEPAAKKSSMGINTARTHLKKVFSKTQTGRQAELVQLLLRTVGFVKFD